MDCREVKIGKDDIMLMGGDICGYLKIDFFHSMVFSDLIMNNCGKVQESYNEHVPRKNVTIC